MTNSHKASGRAIPAIWYFAEKEYATALRSITDGQRYPKSACRENQAVRGKRRFGCGRRKALSPTTLPHLRRSGRGIPHPGGHTGSLSAAAVCRRDAPGRVAQRKGGVHAAYTSKVVSLTDRKQKGSDGGGGGSRKVAACRKRSSY